ncbi:MAG: monovalent cation:proton antiporter-2 (CPA2) family protein [Alcanivoracaceae bacterium]|nr:monovalent cation:proton antiporter-2 (CPA2) family protein [Alcanivoracaceae bacterium]
MHQILLNIAIYLTAAIIVVTLSKRLGFGSVLGYLVAGTLLGPYVLGFVGDPESILHFAEFGVVIMLFLIGLELKPHKLWSLRRAILGIGGAQVVLTAALLSGVLVALGVAWRESLLIGLALALSSTAIVLQTLEERGILNSGVGQNTFAVLLFQDIAVIPMLAVIPLLAVSGGDGAAAAGHGNLLANLPEYLQALVMLGVIAGIILVGRYLLRPVFRVVADANLPELFTGFVLLIVVAVTLGMMAIGLSPALGAFIAGVVLAESEFRHEIEADLNPFKGLLMGLFFLSVGAGINYPLLAESPLIIAGCVVGLMLVKFLVLKLVGNLFGFNPSERTLFGISLAQGGEFAFVISATALSLSALSAARAEMLNLVVAMSMVGTTLLFMAFDQWKKRAPHTAPNYDTPPFSPLGGVIIAGYGRFGQIIGRLLTSQNVPITILDSSPGQVDLVRRFGNQVFYGDASRHSLLEQAGAKQARLLVVAVDNAAKALEIVDTAQHHFPALQIVCRAVDRNHAYQLMQHKVTAIRRETFHSALKLGEDALLALGQSAEDAARHTQLFGEHDQHTLETLAEVWGDEKRYGVAVHQNLDNLRRVLEVDRSESSRR